MSLSILEFLLYWGIIMVSYKWIGKDVPIRDRAWIRSKSKWKLLVSSRGGKCERCGECDVSILKFVPIPFNPSSRFSRWGEGEYSDESSDWLLCSNCSYEMFHGSVSSGSKSTRDLLSFHGVSSCVVCGYSNNKNVLCEHDGMIKCRNCKGKSVKDSRWCSYSFFIDDMCSHLVTVGSRFDWLFTDESFLSRLDSMYISGSTYRSISIELLCGIDLSLTSKIKVIGDLIRERISSGLLRKRFRLRDLDSMSSEDLVRHELVSKVLVHRRVGHSTSASCKELRISKSSYDYIIRLCVSRGLCESLGVLRERLDIDDKIIEMSALGKSAVAISTELGCCVSTVREKRQRLIESGLMAKPDYGSYTRGREAWNKGLRRDLSEVQLQMLCMREDGFTAAEVASEVGKTVAAVRLFYSKCIKEGLIDAIPPSERYKKRR